MEIQTEYGIQPLDEIMVKFDLCNHDLVRCSLLPLTHKMVQKGRKGRRLTTKIQRRIVEALNRATGSTFHMTEVFSYQGG